MYVKTNLRLWKIAAKSWALATISLQTMNSVGSNSQSLKYQRFTPSDWQDIEIDKFEFVAETHPFTVYYSGDYNTYYIL